MYLDLGDRTYCTVAIPRGKNGEDGNHGALDEMVDEHGPLKPLFDQT